MKHNPQQDESVYTKNEMEHLISMLEYLSQNSEQLAFLPEPQKVALLTAAGKLSRPSRDEINKRRKQKNLLRRQQLMTKERAARAATVTPPMGPTGLTIPQGATPTGIRGVTRLMSARSWASASTKHKTRRRKILRFDFRRRRVRPLANRSRHLTTLCQTRCGHRAGVT